MIFQAGLKSDHCKADYKLCGSFQKEGTQVWTPPKKDNASYGDPAKIARRVETPR